MAAVDSMVTIIRLLRWTEVLAYGPVTSRLPAHRNSRSVLLRLRQHEVVEERSELGICIEREHVRDVLIGPHDDHAACPPIDAAHCKDVVAALEVGAEHLLVVEQTVTSLAREKQRGHGPDVEHAMSLLEHC